MGESHATDAFNPEREFMEREEIEDRQERMLREKVEHAYKNTSHYREAFDEADIDPSDIKTIDDYQRLVPTMLKEDVRENRSVEDPFGGFLAVDRDEIDYYHTSTGTTGTPTFMPVQETEVSAASELIARTLYPSGIAEGDVALNAGMFYHLYSRMIEDAYHNHLDMIHFNRGGLPFEVESDLEEDVELWEMGNPAVINMTHSSLQKATTLLQEHDIDPSDAFPELKAVVTAGAVVTGTARQELEEFWGVPLIEHGGPTDQMSFMGTFCEARTEGWGHFFEDQGFHEIIDLDTLEPVAEGERGEHTYTTFHLDSTPYLRWRSEDAGVHGGYDCSCGRCHMRTQILGRTVQAVNVQETSVFPRDFEEVRDRHGYPESPYQIVRRPEQPQDLLTVLFSADISDQERTSIVSDLAESLGLEESDVDMDHIDEDDIPMKGQWKYRLIRDEDE
ncbi:phenylacetate--CoA ligase family protein [Natronorubrum tibetense]|uniref:Phenylacetate--CoA ligase n=1 Tax=Natronorubrum tibetense GA33 TaxID=1114856 RepID=L9VNF4_9EURY|nr:phenylacetate--CoA ligase family protein [Natronorubrum tibetense]ELY37788.1 phenylacetate--CoA ligase [Natronorubrum tibetense GA33]